jgi:hypothetical protein
MSLYQTLVNRLYFDGEYTIGQSEQPAVEAELNLFIRRYEYDFLVQLLGLPLYEAFYAGMQGDEPATRWLEMAYGKAFLLDAASVKTGCKVDAMGRVKAIPSLPFFDKMNVNYRGLLNAPEDLADPSLLHAGYGATSPIAKYIYYHWMKSHATTTGGSGESTAAVHNATPIANTQKMCRAYNEMCKEVIDFYHFLDMYIMNYPEFDLEPNSRFAPAPINQYNFL